jgi:hypothetical protein
LRVLKNTFFASNGGVPINLTRQFSRVILNTARKREEKGGRERERVRRLRERVRREGEKKGGKGRKRGRE